ncbi:MAG: hypothetical protein K6T85_00555 [Gorillibacterium sp.]|nr:hypothetical protein [Gorillibacterium sp.]
MNQLERESAKDQADNEQVDIKLEAEFNQRCALLMDAILQNPIPEGDRSRRRMYHAITRLGLGKEREIAYADLAASNANPGHDAMFFRHANIDAWLRFGDQYPEELRVAVEQQMCESEQYQMETGTENHKIMNAVTGYLTAQCWPNWDQAAVVNQRCFRYLQDYFFRVTRYGQGEFDSPTYSVLYLNTLATLYDFSLSRLLKRQARMMLDWYLANTAGEWLNGSFIGAHSRDYHPTDTHNEAPAGVTAAWLYFGGRIPSIRSKGEPHYSIINALSSYRPLNLIVRIAQDRNAPFVHRETHDITAAEGHTNDNHETNRLTGQASKLKGYGYISRAGVHKYTYVTKGYGLGSMMDGKQGDIIWSGQLRRWSLDWDTEQPRGVLFFNHPFPDFGHADEAYVEKWQGSSPYEQVLQDEGALIALYNIPAGETYRYKPRNPFPSDQDAYIDGFFSDTALLLLEEDDDEWIFGHGGSMLVAVHVCKPWHWQEDAAGNRRLRSEGLRNGVIVQTAIPEEYRLATDANLEAGERLQLELARFRQAFKRETRIVAALDEGQPSISYKALNGNQLKIVFDQSRTINGTEVCLEEWPLIANPQMNSIVGSGVLQLRYGSEEQQLNYNDWNREISPQGGKG